MEAVQTYGSVGHWAAVADCLEGRSASQCRERWVKSLNPELAKGKWDDREVRLLFLAMRAHGERSFSAVARHVPRRDGPKCREKWTNVLDPSLRHGAWAPEENAALEARVQEHGIGAWSAIAAQIPGRTDDMCKRRWTAMHKEASAKHRKRKSDTKHSLPSKLNRRNRASQLSRTDFEVDDDAAENEGGE